MDRTVYSAFSTVNKFALSVQDDRFIFESNIAGVLASRLSIDVEPLVLKKSEPFHHLIYQSGLRALVEVSSPPFLFFSVFHILALTYIYFRVLLVVTTLV